MSVDHTNNNNNNNNNSNNNIDLDDSSMDGHPEIDEALFSRQLYVLGHEAMLRMRVYIRYIIITYILSI